MISDLVKIGLLVVFYITILRSKVYGSPIEEKENEETKLYNPEKIDFFNEATKWEQIQKINDLLQDIKYPHYEYQNNLFSNYENEENISNENLDDGKIFRERRRLSVFKNIYQKCRIQKRKEKTLCLYLANLYQNVKGFHGL